MCVNLLFQQPPLICLNIQNAYVYAHRRKMRRVATLLNLVVFACSLEFKTQVDVQWHLRQLALSIRISSISRDEIQFSLCAPGCQSLYYQRKVWRGVADQQTLESNTPRGVSGHLRQLALSIRISSFSRDKIQFSSCAPGCCCQSLLHPRKVLRGVPDRQIVFGPCFSSISRDEIQFSMCAPGCQSSFHPRKV